MSDAASLYALFISSFLAATLLPGGSEAALFAVLKAYPETFWFALVIATIGNTLGGMVTFGMGRLLPQRMGVSNAAGHPPAYSSRVQTQQLKHVDKLRRFGPPALLLAWVPLVGDALCLAAGWLRLNWWQSALFMALGKSARYLMVALVVS
jgi:membrane protein YqaA with SNARE-associated domain